MIFNAIGRPAICPCGNRLYYVTEELNISPYQGVKCHSCARQFCKDCLAKCEIEDEPLCKDCFANKKICA